jgi:hypothetical protein
MNVEFSEESVPLADIDAHVDELVELYGGELLESQERAKRFVLPLRRGIAASGGVECSVTWSDGRVTLTCNRDVDAPKAQRVALLTAGVIGALLFTVWPFYGKGSQMGTLAWIGGAVALAVYFLTLRRASGGVAFDFLQRLVRRQRGE